MMVLMVMVLMVDDFRKLMDELGDDIEQPPESKCINRNILGYPKISSAFSFSLRLTNLFQSLLAVV